MTKAERTELEEAVRVEMGDWSAECSCPKCKAMTKLLAHIDALEAQLAQRDERIKKLRDFIKKCSDGIFSHGYSTMEEVVTAAPLALAADAKEGEGK